MMQALLADRFKMKLRRDPKEFPVYGLVAAKSGIKLKESPPGVDADTSEGGPGAVNVTASGGRGGATVNFGKRVLVLDGEQQTQRQENDDG